MRFRELDQHYLESEAGPGGWYPLGANQTWHNGIHLTRPRNRVVRAVAPGRIVAARFARNDELDGYSFGSPGFVLVKHRADAFPAEPVRSEKVGDSSLGRVTTEITFVRDLETGKDWQQLPIGSIVEVVEGGGAESNNSSRKNESSSSGTITRSEMGCRRYTIEKGDTLSEIAQRMV
jgi:hypothetical protein